MNPQLAAMLQLWASLRAAHHLYWTLHWQAKGTSFQGDHTLFSGLYQERVEEIDNLAELIAGHYGAQVLEPMKAWKAAEECIAKAMAAPNPIAIAEMVLSYVEAANDICMDGKYPAGTTNLIADIGTNHLKALYKLQQRYAAGQPKL